MRYFLEPSLLICWGLPNGFIFTWVYCTECLSIIRIKKGIEMRSLWDKIKDPFEIEKNRRECFEALDELNRTIERLNRNLK